jgi:transcriptional regulator with XRE-family HTH domain
MTPTPRQVGVKLRQLRQKKKLSQAALAARAGFTREYVNKIEAGRYNPPLTTLNELAKALRVKLTALLE